MLHFADFCLELFVDVKRTNCCLSVKQVTDCDNGYYTVVLSYLDLASGEVAENCVYFYDGQWHTLSRYCSSYVREHDKQYPTFAVLWDGYMCGFFEHAVEWSKKGFDMSVLDTAVL